MPFCMQALAACMSTSPRIGSDPLREIECHLRLLGDEHAGKLQLGLA